MLTIQFGRSLIGERDSANLRLFFTILFSRVGEGEEVAKGNRYLEPDKTSKERE